MSEFIEWARIRGVDLTERPMSTDDRPVDLMQDLMDSLTSARGNGRVCRPCMREQHDDCDSRDAIGNHDYCGPRPICACLGSDRHPV